MAAQRDWWRRPDQDDDAEISADQSWLDEDFDFDDDRATVSSLWNRYVPTAASYTAGTVGSMKRLVEAQRLVQGFIDAFATGDSHRYIVTFDATVKTAGTDFRGKRVVVSHRPLLDKSIDPELGQTVMTAMAVHEADHVRYGRLTHQAIERAYPEGHADRSRALRVSNILDDVRIERRHAEDFPGYGDIFDPAIDYVFNSTHDRPADPRRLRGCDFISGAVRYTRHVAWTPETEAERDWWLAWSDRGSANDSPKHHVAAVAEALAHLDEMAAQPEPEPQPQPEPQPEQSDESGDQSGDADQSDDQDDQDGGESGGAESEPSDETDARSDSSSAVSGSDESDESDELEPLETDQASTGAPTGSGRDDAEHDSSELPEDCWSDDVDAAAMSNDPQTTYIESTKAQQMVSQGQAIDFEAGAEVYWSPDGLARSKSKYQGRTSGAGAAIRAAFALSRTGNFAKQRDLRSGRLDNRSLPRIAGGDFRLFERRSAQSEGKYRVWLLVDCSSSMRGHPILKAIDVAAALASATKLLPNVALDVWGWTTPWKFRWGAAGRSVSVGAVRVYADGDPVDNVGYLGSVPMGFTPDAEALTWAGKAIRKAIRPGEQPVIIIASDGAGSMKAETVAAVRKSGVAVLSVALAGALSARDQQAWYGEHGYVPWKGSIAATAKPLGRLIGRIAQGKGAKA